MFVFMRVLVLMTVIVFMRVPTIVAVLMLVVVLMTMIVLVPTVPVIMFMLIGVGVDLPVLVGIFVLLVRVDRPGMDAELHPGHVLALAALEVHVKIADLQLGQLPLERGRLHPEVAQRAHGHVAADAGETIEKQDFHRKRDGPKTNGTALASRPCF